MDTFIGERLNVQLSQNKYEIKNNFIYGEDMDGPFIEVMKRGVGYRQKDGGDQRIDKLREEAEVIGFLKIQEVLCNPGTSIGTMMLSVSPKGKKDSLYQHNFYDIFTLKEENSKRFIEARRYSSILSNAEYKNKLSSLHYVPDAVDDAYFLNHPIKVDNVFFENADQIHSYLHRDHKVTELEQFQRIIRSYLYDRAKQKYIRTKDPRFLDAIMNIADVESGFVQGKYARRIDDLFLSFQQRLYEISWLVCIPYRPSAPYKSSDGYAA